MMQDFCKRWETRRLASLFSENKNLNTFLVEKNALQFKYGNIVAKKQYELTDDLVETYRKYTIVQPGDIMINGLNLNYDFVTQRVAQVSQKGIITSAYIALSPHSDVVSKYYLYYFKALDSIKAFNGMGTGIRLTLSFELLKSMRLPVPPREEQDQIVRFLDWKVSSINKLILNYRNRIVLLDEIKQKQINKSAIEGLRKSTLIHNEDIRWDIDYPVHWKIRRARELFSFRKGLSITKANLEETGVAVISYGQVHSKKNTGVGLNEDLVRYVNDSYLSTNQSCLVEKGDFVFADTSEDVSGCGNCVYVDWDNVMFAGYHSIIAHSEGSANNKYFAYLFQSPTWRYQIRKKVNGVKVYSITQKILKDAFILLPPDDEQREIVRHLDDVCEKINAVIQKTEEKIVNLQDLKTRLISDVVTGKIDVRGIDIPDYEFTEEVPDAEPEIDGEDEFSEQEG